MGARIWAYLVPVKLKATVETEAKGKPVAPPPLAATVQVGDTQPVQAQDEEV